MIPDKAVEAAMAAFEDACSNVKMVPCARCNGKGYHHGFGENGHDPDWCLSCQGSGHDMAPGEDKRPWVEALSAALPHLPGWEVRNLEWGPYPNPRFAGPDVAVAPVPEFLHQYQVQRDPWASTYIAYLHPVLPITDSTKWWETKGHETIEAAKASAQADYEARIKAALVAPPKEQG